MKLRKNLLFIITISSVASNSCLPMVGCANSSIPKINSIETKQCPICTLSGDDFASLKYELNPSLGNINVNLINNSVIPYISIEEYVTTQMKFSEMMGPDFTNYKVETKDNKTIITNLFNNQTCTIDYAKQKVIYSDYDKYWSIWKKSDNPFLAAGLGGGEGYFVEYKTTQYICPNEYVIDLQKYHFVTYFDGKNGYLPFDLFAILINPEVSIPLYFNGVKFYEVNVNKLRCDKESSIRVNQPVKEEQTIICDEYMEYTYNLMALFFDFRYGLNERPLRSNPAKTFTYFPNGAYQTLAPYKDRIISTNPNTSSEAIKDFMKFEVDDSRHSVFKSLNILADKTFASDPMETYGVESQRSLTLQKWLKNAKNKSNLDDDSKAGMGYTEYTDPNYPNTIISYITFDSFVPAEDLNADEQDKGRVLPEYVTEDNYTNNTERLIAWSNKKIRQNLDDNKNVKIVLDLSLNGGGPGYIEHYITSWLCGGFEQIMWNMHTGTFSKYWCEADMDADGDFDANDYIPDDVDVYCITTNKSFSCGNMLPCNLYDYRPNTKFIGDWTGGGACSVENNVSFGLGTAISSSSCFQVLMKGSTPSRIKSVEQGVVPEWYYIKNTYIDSPAFYDRDNLNEKIFADQ